MLQDPTASFGSGTQCHLRLISLNTINDQKFCFIPLVFIGHPIQYRLADQKPIFVIPSTWSSTCLIVLKENYTFCMLYSSVVFFYACFMPCGLAKPMLHYEHQHA